MTYGPDPLAKEDMPYAGVAFTPARRWCKISGMSLSSTYRALTAGHLEARKVVGVHLIDVQKGLAWIRSHPLTTYRKPAEKHGSRT